MFTVYRSQIGNQVEKLRFFGDMAFNLLSQLINRPSNDEEEDEGSPVDDVDEEIGEESDVECDGEEDNDSSSVDLDSNDDGVGPQGDVGVAWSDQLHNVCNTKCRTSF